MPRIRVYDRERTTASGSTAGFVAPSVFSQLGEAVGDFGSSLAVVAEAERRREGHAASRSFLDFEAVERAAHEEARTRAAPDARDFTRTAMTAFEERADALLAATPERLRPVYEAQIDGLRSDLGRRNARFEVTTRSEHYERSLSDAEGRLLDTIARDPETFERTQALGLHAIEQSGLDPQRKAERTASWRALAQTYALRAKLAAAGWNGEGEESVEALMADARFAETPEEKRLSARPIYDAALQDRTRAEQVRTANAAKARFVQSAATLEAMRARIAKGEPIGRQVALARATGRLNPTHGVEANGLLTRLDEEFGRETALRARLADPNATFDPQSADDRAGFEAVFRREGGADRLKARDDNYVLQELSPLFRRTGLASQGAVESLTGLARSDDAAASAWALGHFDRLDQADSQAFRREFGIDAAGRLADYRRALASQTPEGAAAEASRIRKEPDARRTAFMDGFLAGVNDDPNGRPTPEEETLAAAEFGLRRQESAETTQAVELDGIENFAGREAQFALFRPMVGGEPQLVRTAAGAVAATESGAASRALGWAAGVAARAGLGLGVGAIIGWLFSPSPGAGQQELEWEAQNMRELEARRREQEQTEIQGNQTNASSDTGNDEEPSDKTAPGPSTGATDNPQGATQSEPQSPQDNSRPQISGETEHAKQRAEEARVDPHRDVGDHNRVVREGRRFEDTETGLDVYVNGDRVVILNKDGVKITSFTNTRKNTQYRIRTGKWKPKD